MRKLWEEGENVLKGWEGERESCLILKWGTWLLMTSNACQYMGVPVAVSTRGQGSVCLVSWGWPSKVVMALSSTAQRDRALFFTGIFCPVSMSENNKKGNMPAWHIVPFGVSCLFPRYSEPAHNSKIFLFVNFWLKLLKHLPNFLTTSSDLCNGIKCAFQRNWPKATPSFLCCYFCFLWVQAVSRLPDVTERWRLWVLELALGFRTLTFSKWEGHYFLRFCFS